MKLYYSPGACSLAPHIITREAGLDLEFVKVRLPSHTTEDGGDYYAINPRGYVPALTLDDGSLLTEAAVVIQYLADQNVSSGLMPPYDTIERVRAQQWLVFIATELHKSFGPLFHGGSDEVRDMFTARLATRFTELEGHFADNRYLMGDDFRAPDAYAFTVLRWAPLQKIDLSPYPNITAYVDRVAARPKVRAAMEAEGLLKRAA